MKTSKGMTEVYILMKILHLEGVTRIFGGFPVRLCLIAGEWARIDTHWI